jgi:transposase
VGPFLPGGLEPGSGPAAVRAYDSWWNSQHPAGPPTFKKRRNRLAVPFPGQAIKVHKLNRKWAQVRLPKVGWVRFRLSRPLGGVVRNATVSRDGLGWHVSFGVAQPRPLLPQAAAHHCRDCPAQGAAGAQAAGLHHKLTTDLAKSHGWVGIEDLRVREMTRSDNSPFERRRQLAYKTERYGSQLRLVRPAFTSQTCSTRRNRRPSGR